MSQNRSLGEGRICKMVKKCAYIIDERLGSVYFPIEAASISGPCSDLREKFTTDEEVIFTAQKHAQAQNDCQYVATSVVKKRELIPATGKICEIYDKYCYAEIKKYGRVFVPYSARNSFNKLNKPWLGYGAEIDKRIHLKIFPQPDIKNCRYVAWSIDMNVADEKKGYDKVHDTAKEQIGIIVICPAEGDLTVYSSQSGKACLPSSQREPWMQLGTCIRYDVVRQTDGGSRCTWVVKSVENLGLLYEIIVDNKDSSKLLLRLNAVVNRVSSGTYTAWLWNDVIGRIFVPSYQFKCRLRAMTCVEIVASWTGVFEDVPWTAVELEVLGDDTAIRTQNASLLLTDDNWTVPSNGTNQTTFFGFINNPKYGSAFIAWTDLTKDDTPPVPEAKCRATVFFQSRSGKHCWRAVLVTPLSENGYPIWEHPLYNHSGQLTLPQPYQLPPPVLPKPAEQAPPNIVSPLPATLPEMDQTHDALFSAVTGSNDNGMAPMSPIITEPAELSPVARSFGTEGTNNYPNQVDLLDQLDLGMLAYASAIYSHSDNIWGPVKGLGTFGTMSMSDSLLPPPSGSSPSSPTSADATTQTDIMSEQEVLKDIMNNKELFSKVKIRPPILARFRSMRRLTIVILCYVIAHTIFYVISLTQVSYSRRELSKSDLSDGPLVLKDGVAIGKSKIVKKSRQKIAKQSKRVGALKSRTASAKGVHSGKVHTSASAKQNRPFLDEKSLKNVIDEAKILHKSRQLIYFTIVNGAFERLTLNWLCNVGTFKGTYDIVLIVSTSKKLCESVHREYQQKVRCLFADVPGYEEDLDWGEQKYIDFLVIRAQLMKALTMSSVRFVLIETDSTWFRDPFELFVNATIVDDADIVVPIKGLTHKGDSLAFSPMLVEPTNASVVLFEEMTKRIQEKDDLYDQDVMNELCRLQYHGVVCRSFEYNEIADGKWFHLDDSTKNEMQPYIVNNNFYVGLKNKEARQAINGLWFLTKAGRCSDDRVDKALKRHMSTS
ncbi:hypothetical protein Q1695_013578 [Nippostrongylus brasiliensis]|nr:hypothetical protein Q1695_013578 [Nippostrongylus brasiliensis]